jgi:hypothetical protein
MNRQSKQRRLREIGGCRCFSPGDAVEIVGEAAQACGEVGRDGVRRQRANDAVRIAIGRRGGHHPISTTSAGSKAAFSLP